MCFFYGVTFVQQNPVCECNLLHGFIFYTWWLLFIKVHDKAPCVHNREDTIKLEFLLYVIICKEGLRNRRWVRQSSGLNHDSIQGFVILLCIFDHLFQTSNEVP